ncbi:hypothetical protein MARINON1_20138 [Marinobacter salarius]|nr:conserved hypothetical protein [Marinobacter salarius]VXA95528.1 hypothetical protein MARINON1_20138 [Marinobacter salarius]
MYKTWASIDVNGVISQVTILSIFRQITVMKQLRILINRAIFCPKGDKWRLFLVRKY